MINDNELTNETKIDDSVSPMPVNDRRTKIKRKGKLSEINAHKHRISDLKWRQNIANSFTILESIVSENKDSANEDNGIKRVRRSRRLLDNGRKRINGMTRIEILKNTIEFISNKESEIIDLIRKKRAKIGYVPTDAESGNELKIYTDVFNYMEELMLKEETNKCLDNDDNCKNASVDACDEKDSQMSRKIDSPSVPSLNEHDYYNSFAVCNDQIVPEDNHLINANVNDATHDANRVPNPIDSVPNYDFPYIHTYNAKIPDPILPLNCIISRSSFTTDFINDKFVSNDVAFDHCFPYDRSYISPIPLHWQYPSLSPSIDSISIGSPYIFGSFVSPKGGDDSHQSPYYYNPPQTPRGECPDKEPINKSKLKRKFFVHSRPANCRRKLKWDQSDDNDNDWPGIMAFVNASGDGPDIASGDVQMSKDFQDLGIHKTDNESSIQSLNDNDNDNVCADTKDAHNGFDDETHNIPLVSDLIDDSELRDFLNGKGHYATMDLLEIGNHSPLLASTSVIWSDNDNSKGSTHGSAYSSSEGSPQHQTQYESQEINECIDAAQRLDNNGQMQWSLDSSFTILD